MRSTLLLLLASGCATLSGARPLEPGRHEVGATLGGGMVMFAGSPLPLPNITAQGRSGVAMVADRPLDLSYGMSLTALPFGVFAPNVGASYLLADQNGAVPAFAVTNRLWLATNAPGLPYKENGKLELWAADQLEVDASWETKGQLFYIGAAQYFDLAEPRLTLTPVLGATFDPSPADPNGVHLHAQVRWFGVSDTSRSTTVQWAGGGQGILGATLGVSGTFGSAP